MTEQQDRPGFWAQGDGMHFPEARSPAHAVRLYRAALARGEVAVNAGATVDGAEIPALRRRVAALEAEVRRLRSALAPLVADPEAGFIFDEDRGEIVCLDCGVAGPPFGDPLPHGEECPWSVARAALAGEVGTDGAH